MKFSEQLRLSVQLRPLLVRPEQAALLLGSGEVVADFVTAGWLTPVISQHRLVLYALRHLEECVRRLESGEVPPPSNGSGSMRMPLVEPAVKMSSFLDQARGIINMKPLLLRPPEAVVFIGSIALLEEFRRDGWIKPLYDRHRLVLFSVRHLEACVARMECGEMPTAYADGAPKAKPPVMVTAMISPAFTRKARRTRRPMPMSS